ncbi:MAG: HEAT repeat domain-containing protein [Acidobacteriota bacterium]|nr:HEAT repeat domain-containing protein [Acidobacteriota bacterium]
MKSSAPQRLLRNIAIPLSGVIVISVFCAWRSGALRASGRTTALEAGAPTPAALTFDHELTGSIHPGETLNWQTPALRSGDLYSVDISLDRPGSLTTADELVPGAIASPITFNIVKKEIIPIKARVVVSFNSPGNPVISKKLHSGDPGTYFIIRAAATSPAHLTLQAPQSVSAAPMGFEAEIRPLTVSGEGEDQIAPNTARDWQHASPMLLGKTVFGTSDDIEYLYNTDEGKVGWQWLTFDYQGAKKLVFFELNVLDRDVPCALKFYRLDDSGQGKRVVEYSAGKSPVEIRHDDQTDALVDHKFITRVLTPGRYYVAVKSNDPRWSLRTEIFNVPPYQDPHEAAQVALRYMVDIADSWFSDIPRKGAVLTRAENVTDETERCIACHAAHFTMLSTLKAQRHGYSVANEPEYKFMIDRLYNAPAPFYGFPHTYWLRFELAPTNGLSRMAKMLLMYEDSVSHRPTEIPAESASYIRLVYDARSMLPRVDKAHFVKEFEPAKTRNYEFDGNRPISDFRVASDSWFDLSDLARRGRNAAYAQSAAHLKTLMTTDKTNDLEDIVEQTKGMVEMGDPKFKPAIRANIQKILARQHTDGGWVTAEYMSNHQFFDAAARAAFEKKTDPSLQFMTGEVLYTLKIAGYNMQDPRIQKAIHWLLGLQKPFGGWLDNKGELFLLPQKETCWSLIALSTIYPESNPPLAPAPPEPLSVRNAVNPPVAPTLQWLDQVWYQHDPSVLKNVLPLLQNPEPLIREAAASAIGRMAVDAPDPAPFRAAVQPLAALLGDHTKMVSRAAAWSLRQLGNDGVGIDATKTALNSPDDYTRRGAARVFYQYWYHMIPREDVARELIAHVNDPDMLVRIECLKALWRWWYRTPDFALRRQIERAFLSRAAVEREDPIVRLNVAQAIYNILDDNTVQFHRNWLRSMALEKDRQLAEAARIREVERPLASELAAALSTPNASLRATVLTGLDYYFLRGGIGNDYDSITFYDPAAAETMARAILPLISSPDQAIASKALQAAAVARDAGDQDLLLAVMDHLGSSDPATREIAEEELAKFPAQYNYGGNEVAKSKPLPRQPRTAKLHGRIRPAAGGGF